jgi:regulator of sigma E protease
VGEYLRSRGGDQPKTLDPSSEQFDKAAAEIGLGETEYRWNWMPLGGYVKMLGQDDMNPNAVSDDPRAYNRKSIGARMIVVSAGVVMNVILAAILFMVVFLVGFNTQPALIGGFETGSPAQKAGLRVGDRVRYYDGDWQHSFDKLVLNVALSKPGEAIPMVVERWNETNRKYENVEVKIRPERMTAGGGLDLLVIGTERRPAPLLEGLDPKVAKVSPEFDRTRNIAPGEKIVAVEGVRIEDTRDVRSYVELDRRIQQSGGKPVRMTISDAANAQREIQANVSFEGFFLEFDNPFHIAGFQPRVRIRDLAEDSPVKGKLQKGDIIAELKVNGQTIPGRTPTLDEFIRQIEQAGDNKWKVDFVVEREGKVVPIEGVVPTYPTKRKRGARGVGVNPGYEEDKAIIAGARDNTPAKRITQGVPNGSQILAVDGQKVENWFDVHTRLRAALERDPNAKPVVSISEPVQLTDQRRERQVTLEFGPGDREALAAIRYTHELLLRPRYEPRETDNPLVAMGWGVGETWDMLRQFYVTLHRLTVGSVSASNLMGPVGIVQAGSKFAMMGPDWLIWFLAMISANLAVVNFLPIPIVDGGLFTFLVLEKVMGRPLSPRMQTVAQLVGLALIFSIFVFVTYNDIARIFFY